MNHLITISIILAGLYIPYAISRYILIRKKPTNIDDIATLWVLGLLSITLTTLLIIVLRIVYTEIYNNL